MEAAAQRARELAQKHLPQTPHHLALSLNSRFPGPPGFWFDGKSAPLQYMTFCSDADRGILLTRPSYDVCVDPPDAAALLHPPSAARRPSSVAKPDAVKKKLSFKDYRNKIKSHSPTTDNDPATATATATAATTTAATASKMIDHDKAGAPIPDPKADHRTSLDRPEVVKAAPAPPPSKENGKKEEAKETKPGQRPEARDDPGAKKARQEVGGDRNPSRLPDAQPAEGRKRHVDADDTPPPPKRSKLDAAAAPSNPDPPRQARPSDTPKGRERDGGRDQGRERERERERPSEKANAHKEARNASLHLANTNGGRSLSPRGERDRTASPRPAAQVNGTRRRSSVTLTPQKVQAHAKNSLVPQLLSPLHPSVERELTEQKQRVPAKARREADDDGPAPAPLKKPKALKLPQLLSPTLPPVLEAELARLKRTPSKEDLSQKSGPEPPSATKKGSNRAAPGSGRDGEPPKRTLIVTLKLRKATAKRAKDLLSLPSKAAKEAQKMERSLSVEDALPAAKKRPRQTAAVADDLPLEGQSAKRQRTTVMSEGASARTAPAPSTPLKPAATSMSRAASSQSLTNTPGTMVPMFLDGRPPTRAESIEPTALRPPRVLTEAERKEVEGLRMLNRDYFALGSTLKHERDAIVRGTSGIAGPPPTLDPAEERHVIALHMEMVLTYMLAFQKLNQMRRMEGRMPDLHGWESLLPHLRELSSRMTRARGGSLGGSGKDMSGKDSRNAATTHTSQTPGLPIMALTQQMTAVCLEQVTNAYSGLSSIEASTHFAAWTKKERARLGTWADAHNLSGEVRDGRLKTIIGPWTKIDDAVLAGMGIVVRWMEQQQQQQQVPDAGNNSSSRSSNNNGSSAAAAASAATKEPSWRPRLLRDRLAAAERAAERQDREQEDRDGRQQRLDSNDRELQHSHNTQSQQPQRRLDKERARGRERDRSSNINNIGGVNSVINRASSGHRELSSHRPDYRERDRERDRDRTGPARDRDRGLLLDRDRDRERPGSGHGRPRERERDRDGIRGHADGVRA